MKQEKYEVRQAHEALQQKQAQVRHENVTLKQEKCDLQSENSALKGKLHVLEQQLVRADELIATDSRFQAGALVMRTPSEKGLGLAKLLGITEQDVGEAMEREIDAAGDESDITNMRHVLDGTKYKRWENGQTLSALLQHPDVLSAELQVWHAFALRYYTTSSYKAINDPLRKRQKPHTLAATTYFINVSGLSNWRRCMQTDPTFKTPRRFGVG